MASLRSATTSVARCLRGTLEPLVSWTGSRSQAQLDAAVAHSEQRRSKVSIPVEPGQPVDKAINALRTFVQGERLDKFARARKYAVPPGMKKLKEKDTRMYIRRKSEVLKMVKWVDIKREHQ
ncbi:unnamed protein product [Pedinophyceae sp. YPF-701]|nr:unnamed protein product [Pedinophyceae sp. YPF-701]